MDASLHGMVHLFVLMFSHNIKLVIIDIKLCRANRVNDKSAV